MFQGPCSRGRAIARPAPLGAHPFAVRGRGPVGIHLPNRRINLSGQGRLLQPPSGRPGVERKRE
eukprot:636270-Pyramimonas_sp.AAC.1